MNRTQLVIALILSSAAGPYGCTKTEGLLGVRDGGAGADSPGGNDGGAGRTAGRSGRGGQGGSGGHSGVDGEMASGGAGFTGGGAGNPGCTETIDWNDASNLDALTLGLGNQVLSGPLIQQDPARNHADQLVFDTPTYEFSANFPPYVPGADTDSGVDDLVLPRDLPLIPDYVGAVDLYSERCEMFPVTGRTIRVHLWWKLDAAIVTMPTVGVALGWIENGEFVAAPDAIRIWTAGDAPGNRPLGSLAPIVLEHSFTSDVSDSLSVRIWALDPYGIASRLFVQRVEWE